MSASKHLVLFRSRTQTSEEGGPDAQDNYHSAFGPSTFAARSSPQDGVLTTTHTTTTTSDDTQTTVQSIPILSHALCNISKLAELIEEASWAGVIITSQRAVEAWAEAEKLMEQRHAATEDATSSWQDTPFFVVGRGTASALSALPLPPSRRPQHILGAEETGTGERLAEYIVSHFSSTAEASWGEPAATANANANRDEKDSRRPLLYLVGDKNATTIPRALDEAGLRHTQLQVYETCADPAFSSNLDAARRAVSPERKDRKPDWICFFSPSGLAYAWPELFKRGWLAVPPPGELESSTTPPDPLDSGDSETGAFPRIAALGPATRNYIRDKVGLEVHAIPSKPGPVELRTAIESAERGAGT